jgi:hypothetical protein
MPRKVFTAGEVLAAADVNEFLMDQAVQSFAGTAARGSAIPTPVTGMTTYLEDTKDLRTYDGSAYISTSGLTLIKTTSFTAQATVSFDNVFTSEFTNYRALINAASSTGTTMGAQMRDGGSPITTSTYNAQVNDIGSTSYFAVRITAAASVNITTIVSGSDTVADIVIGNPALSKNTVFITNAYYPSINISQIYGENTNATAYDGVQFILPTGTMTGTISIYGMKK